eukprot:maker-scaffold675_size187964-snap-gene-0.28 protein:Tk03273 transcript:maker-scaffold675_size187964-snap-gene-0.28-mRNA-1 annotation:"hypothetical protein DAPPUDRAFT_187565"
MAPHDTPPTSPGVNLPPDLEEEEAGEAGAGDLDLGDVVEVIDLDELVEQAQGMDDDDEEDSLEAMASEDESEQPLEPPPEDNSAQSFLGHGRSVFNVSFHPKNPNWAASGGEDDCAYIWDTGTGEVVLKCDGFNDSVVFVAFSHDGSFLAASDMSGVIKVWRTSSKEVIWEFETSDISWMSWHQSGNVLFVTTVDSELWMWKIPSGESKLFAGHGEKAETAKVLHDGKRAIVGYSDGSLRLFDLKSGEVLHNLSGNTGHVASVTSIAVRDDNNLIGSGGVDGTAKLFNIQSGKNIGTFKCGSKDEDSEEVDSKSTVEATLFSKPEMNLLITGTLEGTINIWDLASHVSRQAFSVGTGITKMEWRQGSSTEILVATLDGLVRLADVRGYDSSVGGELTPTEFFMSATAEENSLKCNSGQKTIGKLRSPLAFPAMEV